MKICKINDILEYQGYIKDIGECLLLCASLMLTWALYFLFSVVQMVVTFEALDFIIKSLTENNMAAKSVKSPSIPNLKAQKQKGKLF